MRLIKSILMMNLIISLISCQDTLTNDEWLATLPSPWTLTQKQMSETLPQFQQRFPDFQQRLKHIALWRVGTPYEIFKLGEEVEPDLDPIIRYDVSDCTGHNLTSLAAAKSSNWEEARKNMIQLHYKADSNGLKQPTYRSRWHYTVDRITMNPNTVDITQTLLHKTALDSVNITLNEKEDGNEFLDLSWNRNMTAYYIPNSEITPRKGINPKGS